jgi:ABC-2 type transport system ATP-binding protein
MSAPVIETKGLTKAYGRTRVVDGIDLEVREGEILGLLGPNGAGKTTTILMLLGLTEASAGTVRVMGLDPYRQPLQVKRLVGYLPESVGFYDNMTGRENLRYTAKLGGLSAQQADERITASLEQVRLSDVGDKRAGTYSHGMRQRLGLAELLMRRCRVFILDEPTTGLDPQSTTELLALIRDLNAGGVTVVLSSHLLDVVQSICGRVALFNRGRLGFLGTVEELGTSVADGAFHIEAAAEGVDVGQLAGALTGVGAVEAAEAGGWRITADHDIRAELARTIVEKGGELRSLAAHQISLGEAYNRFFKEVRDET